MSTRSAIILKVAEGRFSGVYCHSDGYPSGVGKTLLEHYQERAKVESLILLGDLSDLGERADPVGPHSFEKPEPGTTLAYMRDRGEKDCEPHHSATAAEVAEGIDHQYAYVFEDGRWTCDG